MLPPRTIARLAMGGLLACALLYFFPLVHIRKLAPAGSTIATPDAGTGSNVTNRSATSDVATFIETLWTKRLPDAMQRAANIEAVLTMAAIDANGARRKFGREVGLGGPTFFFLKGRGRIERVNEDECVMTIDGQGQPQPVILEIGVLVSNAIRDATGLAEVGDFPNSQDFNQLSTVLNSRCEAEVIQPFRDQMKVGALIEFVGCGEVRDEDGFKPLKLIPVRLKSVAAVERPE